MKKEIKMGVDRVIEITGMKIIEWIRDPEHNGNVAALTEAKNKKRYYVLVRNYFMKGDYFFGSSLNKKVVDMAHEKSYGLYIYSFQDDLLYELDTSLIIQKYSNEIEEYHNQLLYKKVDLNSVGAKNVIETRRKQINKPERFLTNLFRDYNLPIFYTGSGEQQFSIFEMIPDWKVENQNKLIEYCGRYWHTEEDIEERKKLFLLNGYKTLIIWEGEEKNIDELINKIKKFIEDKTEKEEKNGKEVFAK